MAREVICPEGERTRILHILSDSIPQTVRFTAEPLRPDRTLEGLIEIERGGTLFGRRADRLPLAASNRLGKGFLDARYAVFVTPGQDTRVTFQSRHFTSRLLYIALGAVLLLGVIAGLGGFVVRWLG